jgi:hypothetical protein
VSKHDKHQKREDLVEEKPADAIVKSDDGQLRAKIGARRLELVRLPEDHESTLEWEVRIEHPEHRAALSRDTATIAPSTEIPYRGNDYDAALLHFEVLHGVLTAQVERDRTLRGHAVTVRR